MTELPGLIGVVDRLLLKASVCREDAECREYIRTCVVGTLLADALSRLVAKLKEKDRIPIEKLYDAVVSQALFNDILQKSYRDFAVEMLAKVIKYLEMESKIKDGVVTRYSLMWISAHIETAMIFLDC
jgi:hypothetical protein